METWHAARAQIPRQLSASPDFKLPLEEEAYRGMRVNDLSSRYSEAEIDASGLRKCGLWTSMLALSEIHGQVMRFNDEIVQNSVPEPVIRQRLRKIAKQLDDWLHTLPVHLKDTPENRDRYVRRGLGREFAVQRLVYHHQSQLLYYRFLNRKAELPELVVDDEAEMFASRCKAHAAALSQVMWDTNSVPGMECLWSPINGHLLVVSSSILLYTLLFDTDNESTSLARTLLEQNFIMLLQFRKYWSLIELSMTRLRAFHRACQMNSTQDNFGLDRWMIDFLNRYDAQVSDRYSDESNRPFADGQTLDTDPVADLWMELSEGLSTSAGNMGNPYFN